MKHRSDTRQNQFCTGFRAQGARRALARVRARGALQLPPIPHPFCVTVLSQMSPKSKPWSKFGQRAQRQLLQDLTALMVPHCETATDVSQLLHALGERVRRSNQSVGPSNSASKLAISLDSPTNDYIYVTFPPNILYFIALLPYRMSQIACTEENLSKLVFSHAQRHEMHKGARKASSLRAGSRGRA